MLLGDRQPEEPDLCHLRHDRQVDGLGAVPLLAERHGLALEEVAGQGPEALLLRREAQVHRGSPFVGAAVRGPVYLLPPTGSRYAPSMHRIVTTSAVSVCPHYVTASLITGVVCGVRVEEVEDP